MDVYWCVVFAPVPTQPKEKRMRQTISRLATAFIAVTLCTQLAGAQTFLGSTAGGPTWNRPIAGNPPTPPVSAVGTAVPFDVFSFQVSVAGNYDFLSTSLTSGFDN